MRNRLLSLLAGTAALVVAAPASLLAADSTAEIPHTPQGIACPQGIVEVDAAGTDSFEFRGEQHTRKSLKKILIAAHKDSRFDCVLITGGEPTSADVMDLVKSLSRRNITHVEWTGTRPATVTPSKE